MDVKHALIDGIMQLIGWLTTRQEDLVALDIRPGMLYLAQLSAKGKDQWILEQLHARPCPVEDASSIDDKHIADNVELYANTLKNLVKSKRIGTANIAITLPVASSIIKVVTAPLMSDEELENAIEYDSLWENLVQFAGSLDDYSIYWQTIRREPSNNSMDLLFIASKLTEINTYADIVRAAGLQAVLMDVRCFPLMEALSFHISQDETAGEKEKLGNSAVVELGTGENYLMIAEGESVYVADIFLPPSGRELLAQQTLSDEQVRVSMTRYVAQLRQALVLYQKRSDTELVQNLLFVSTLPMINTFVSTLQQLLPEVNISLFQPLNNVLVPEQYQQIKEETANLSFFAPALGLAKRKLDVFGYFQYTTTTQNVNLLPNRAQLIRTRKMQILGFFAGLVLLLGVAAFLALDGLRTSQKSTQIGHVMGDHPKLLSQVAELEAELQEVNRLQAKYQQLQGEQHMISEQQQMDIETSLREITAALPNSVWLTSIERDKEQIITIHGGSSNGQRVQSFVERLNNSTTLANFVLLTMEAQADNPQNNVFHLQGRLVFNAPTEDNQQGGQQ